MTQKTWKPCFSRLQLRLDKDHKVLSTLLEVLEKDPDAYVIGEIVAVGSNAGWNPEHTVQLETFSVGDKVLVFEKQCEFFWKDKGAYSAKFDLKRAGKDQENLDVYIKDQFVISRLA